MTLKEKCANACCKCYTDIQTELLDSGTDLVLKPQRDCVSCIDNGAAYTEECRKELSDLDDKDFAEICTARYYAASLGSEELHKSQCAKCGRVLSVDETIHGDTCVQCDFYESINSKSLHLFDSGAVRGITNTRFDLCSKYVIRFLIHDSKYVSLAEMLRNEHNTVHELVTALCDACGMMKHEVLVKYAEALHEGAEKYGDRNWEKGIPESNLVNHAIGHIVMIEAGDTSEDHVAHLIWNVLTFIHFRIMRNIIGDN